MLSLCAKAGGRRLLSSPPLLRSAFTTSTAIPTLESLKPNDKDARRKIIFSGIQPTGVPHLGNYLGALRHWVKLQNEAEKSTNLIFSLVDLHAITIRQDPGQLRQWKRESLAMLLAVGLDHMRCTIFHQSDVPYHAELMWILSCQASTGYLGRMTQWKDKALNTGKEGNNERLKLGLFSYPVLQAADVLVHQTTHVPVGHDQAQHLEFARELAQGFNHLYGPDILTPPETLISPAKRIMSLTDPTSKMSKSASNPKSRVLLTDSEETIKAKLKAAVTDSLSGVTYDPENRPGVSNLLDIIYHAGEASAQNVKASGGQEALARELDGMSLRVVKERAAEVVEAVVKPIREKYASVLHDDALLAEAAEAGAFKAQITAMETIQKVKKAIGLA